MFTLYWWHFRNEAGNWHMWEGLREWLNELVTVKVEWQWRRGTEADEDKCTEGGMLEEILKQEGDKRLTEQMSDWVRNTTWVSLGAPTNSMTGYEPVSCSCCWTTSVVWLIYLQIHHWHGLSAPMRWRHFLQKRIQNESNGANERRSVWRWYFWV